MAMGAGATLPGSAAIAEALESTVLVARKRPSLKADVVGAGSGEAADTGDVAGAAAATFRVGCSSMVDFDSPCGFKAVALTTAKASTTSGQVAPWTSRSAEVASSLVACSVP